MPLVLVKNMKSLMKWDLRYLRKDFDMEKEDYQTLIQWARIGNRAIKKAQRENHRCGLPNVYSKNNRLYFELPDGTMTMENPLTKVEN